jgi:hypothetical protein
MNSYRNGITRQSQNYRLFNSQSLVGAAIALDMAQEIALLKAQLKLYRERHQP